MLRTEDIRVVNALACCCAAPPSTVHGNALSTADVVVVADTRAAGGSARCFIKMRRSPRRRARVDYMRRAAACVFARHSRSTPRVRFAMLLRTASVASASHRCDFDVAAAAASRAAFTRSAVRRLFAGLPPQPTRMRQIQLQRAAFATRRHATCRRHVPTPAGIARPHPKTSF